MSLAILLAVVAVALLLLDLRRIATGCRRPSPLLGGASCALIVFALVVAFVDQAAGRVIP